MLTQLLALATITLSPAPPPQAPGDEMTLTGVVIDLNCYIAQGVIGANHKSCTEACAKAGVQLGILSTDGTIYLPVSGRAGDPTNPRLLQHAEGKVKVTGTHRMVNGLHTIEIKSVTPA